MTLQKSMFAVPGMDLQAIQWMHFSHLEITNQQIGFSPFSNVGQIQKNVLSELWFGTNWLSCYACCCCNKTQQAQWLVICQAE